MAKKSDILDATGKEEEGKMDGWKEGRNPLCNGSERIGRQLMDSEEWRQGIRRCQ
jgi:hypothetical protein